MLIKVRIQEQLFVHAYYINQALLDRPKMTRAYNLQFYRWHYLLPSLLSYLIVFIVYLIFYTIDIFKKVYSEFLNSLAKCRTCTELIEMTLYFIVVTHIYQ